MKRRHPIARASALFVMRYAGWILAGMAFATVLAFPFAARLKLKASFLDLLPPDAPSITHLKQLTDEVGGTSFLIVAIESSDEEAVQKAADLLSNQARAFEDVESVDNRTGSDAFKSSKLLFLAVDSLHELDGKIHDLIGFYRRENNPFFVDLLDEAKPELGIKNLRLEEKVSRIGGFSAKEKHAFMRVVLLKPRHPLSDFKHSERLFRHVQEAAAGIQESLDSPVTFGLTGPYKTRYDEYHVIQEDLKRTGFLSVILVTILMFLFFKKIRIVLSSFLSLGIGIVWACAFAALSVGYLNVISAFLLAILFGLGIDFAIHFLVTFESERKTAPNTFRAVQKTYAAIGKPSLSSALTTSIAFFSLTISQFQGFRHFGLIAGVGILLCFLSILYGLPSLLLITEKIFNIRWDEKPVREVVPLRRVGFICAVLLAGLVFSAFSLTQIPKLHFEYNFKALQEREAQAIVLAERIGDHFGVVLNPVALITPGRQSALELANRINHYIENHPKTLFDFAASIDSHIPKHQEEKISLLQEMADRLERQDRVIQGLDEETKEKIQELRNELKAGPFTYQDIPEGLRDQYEGKRRKVSIVYVYPNASIMDGQVAKRFIKELRDLHLPKDIVMAGEPVVYVDILNLLERDTPRAMMISFGVVILVLLIHFRCFSCVVLVLSPVLFGFLWLCGFAGMTHFSFNYVNMVILPCILGVGIDNGIYIFHRYRTEKKTTLEEILSTTGKAVILASLTTIAAFSALLLARHQGMASLGKLGFWGFASGLLTSVIFIPSMIEFFEMKYWKMIKSLKHQGSF
ncbi:MAG: hypothetical protein COV74_01995 [Candidatus Omnitrophica bacterium CG11_big_fil_rev_8_21_14_0_20_45_26]|uniref:SSD domain-containing protein n=1 Tax=Candidatus Abzuiibacterium crystallinum TaxID=1974748 RepID=A0A2H0LRZ8_9BACT|nr:MAG: hypothetical protein COV74_01995 [Candidatus Omnitrophica bacterium CG11_big_fil_rev_8_21_14_0_20_45_26]PIW65338.1 MAG: hypothetical protein COW12_02400 [Candidatus Omnitrophica bacterium CG12_big_fil_rev_8_21_14_0_65_45_16]